MPIHVDEGTPANLPESTFLPNDVYSQVLDAVVVSCADLLPLVKTEDGAYKVLLGFRDQEPMRGWWIFGGRQQVGLSPEHSLQKRIEKELGFTLETDRLLHLDVASLRWKTRAQDPVDAGCQMFTTVYGIVLSEDEYTALQFNEEYSEIKLFDPQEILDGNYHKMVKHMLQTFLDRIGAATTSLPGA